MDGRSVPVAFYEGDGGVKITAHFVFLVVVVVTTGEFPLPEANFSMIIATFGPVVRPTLLVYYNGFVTTRSNGRTAATTATVPVRIQRTVFFRRRRTSLLVYRHLTSDGWAAFRVTTNTTTDTTTEVLILNGSFGVGAIYPTTLCRILLFLLAAFGEDFRLV